MTKIACSYEDFVKFCEVFDKMNFQAGEYAPSIEELDDVIVPRLPEFISFLLWVDSTGEDTEDNKESRQRIRQILRESFEIVDRHRPAKKKEGESR